MSYFGKRKGRITWATDDDLVAKREGKNCPLPCVRMVGPSGQVVDVPTATGRGIPLHENMYERQILAEKRRKGWVPYFDEEGNKVKGIEKLIRERKDANTARMAEFEEATKSDTKMLVDIMKKLTVQNGGKVPSGETDPA